MSAHEIVWEHLCGVVERGERCPTNDEISLMLRERGLASYDFKTIPTLARQGRLKVEIYGKNWRVIEIDGKRSKERPGGGTPYLVIDRHGRHGSQSIHSGPRVTHKTESERVKRKCSCCRNRFIAPSRYIFICDRCKQTEDWRGVALI